MIEVGPSTEHILAHYEPETKARRVAATIAKMRHHGVPQSEKTHEILCEVADTAPDIHDWISAGRHLIGLTFNFDPAHDAPYDGVLYAEASTERFPDSGHKIVRLATWTQYGIDDWLRIDPRGFRHYMIGRCLDDVRTVNTDFTWGVPVSNLTIVRSLGGESPTAGPYVFGEKRSREAIEDEPAFTPELKRELLEQVTKHYTDAMKQP